MLIAQLPGYARAERLGRRLEEARREAPFLGATEKLCGVRVQLLTLRMFIELCAVRSPFLCGGAIGGEDVVLFLWRLSPRFSRDDAALRARFIERVRPIAFEEASFHRAVRSICRFVDRMLCDKPPSTETRGGQTAPDVSFAASIIDEIAGAYGWSREAILDTALPELMQYLRRIHRAANPELPRFNPITDRVTRRIRERAMAAARAKSIAAAEAAK